MKRISKNHRIIEVGSDICPMLPSLFLPLLRVGLTRAKSNCLGLCLFFFFFNISKDEDTRVLWQLVLVFDCTCEFYPELWKEGKQTENENELCRCLFLAR